MINLANAYFGKYKVVKVKADKNAKRRLADFGIVPGTIIENTNITSHLPCRIIVRGASMMIGRGLGKKIVIEKYNEEE